MRYLLSILFIIFSIQLYAQQPNLQVDGYLRLDPSANPLINLQSGLIHFDAFEGVFKGYNGSNWVPLSNNAHIDENDCPDPEIDVTSPRPKCNTSVTVALDNSGHISLFVDDFDLASTDNCGSYEASFDMGSTITKLDYSCAELGNQLLRIYFTDAKTNQNYCDVLVQVQDNLGTCP